MIVYGIKLTDFPEISSRKFFLFTLETKLTRIEIETHRNPFLNPRESFFKPISFFLKSWRILMKSRRE